MSLKYIALEIWSQVVPAPEEGGSSYSQCVLETGQFSYTSSDLSFSINKMPNCCINNWGMYIICIDCQLWISWPYKAVLNINLN